MAFNNELLTRIVNFGSSVLAFVGLKTKRSGLTDHHEDVASTDKTATHAPSVPDVRDIPDTTLTLASAKTVIIVPGYGMALSQAHHKTWELAKTLLDKEISVSFAISPVAGRTPGHMDVLLAEAGVPYDLIYKLEDINEQFTTCDVALLIGANDITNPAARTDTSSKIYGIPVLEVDKARQVLVIKRGQGTGFSGVENILFAHENTQVIFGDAQDAVQKLNTDVQSL